MPNHTKTTFTDATISNFFEHKKHLKSPDTIRIRSPDVVQTLKFKVSNAKINNKKIQPRIIHKHETTRISYHGEKRKINRICESSDL